MWLIADSLALHSSSKAGVVHLYPERRALVAIFLEIFWKDWRFKGDLGKRPVKFVWEKAMEKLGCFL